MTKKLLTLEERKANQRAKNIFDPGPLAIGASQGYKGIDGLSQVELDAMHHEIEAQAELIRQGNFNLIEKYLVSHVVVLQEMFKQMVLRASATHSEKGMQIYGHLALKAQKHIRVTLQALTELRAPKKAVFIKQQNNAHNQQVNNYAEAKVSEKSKNKKNELLEVIDVDRMDFRASKAAVRVNSCLEPME